MGVATTDSMMVTVVTDEERFGLEPITLSSFVRSANLPITWQVANTNLPPVSCSAVDITLSIDNGEHFDYTLAKQIPNSGSATIALPDVSLRDKPVRLKLSCSNNIFFSISQWADNSEAAQTQSDADDSYLSDPEATKASTRGSTHESVNGTSSSNGQAGAGGSLSLYWLWMLALTFGLKPESVTSMRIIGRKILV
jgi:hypothetical protein